MTELGANCQDCGKLIQTEAGFGNPTSLVQGTYDTLTSGALFLSLTAVSLHSWGLSASLSITLCWCGQSVLVAINNELL